jgi:hypothetical protein
LRGRLSLGRFSKRPGPKSGWEWLHYPWTIKLVQKGPGFTKLEICNRL